MAALARALLLSAFLAPTADGAQFFFRGAETVSRVKILYDSGKFADVVSALPSDSLAKLRGRNLRRASLYLAKSHEHLRQMEKALSVYQLGHRLFPDDVEILTGLAEFYRALRLEEEAQPLYDRILELEPANTKAHLGLAAIDRSLGFLDRSAKHYEYALEISSSDATVWRQYAEVLHEQRDDKTAELAVLRSLELNGQNTDSHLALAHIQLGLGRPDEAVATLEKVLSVAGRGKDLLSAYSLWLLEAGRAEAARKAAEEILTRYPDEVLPLWILARLDLQAGRREPAARRLKQAFEKGRGTFIAEASLVLLKELAAGR